MQQNFIFDKSNWGDSIEYTLDNYSELGEISMDENTDFGMRSFSRERNGLVHEVQAFDFYNEKLYSISLYFYDLDQTSQEILVNKFIEKYGKTKFRDENKQMVDENTFESNTIYTYSVSDELIIMVTITEQIYKFTEEILSHRVRYHYFDPNTMEKIRNEIAKKRTDDIHF